MFIYPQATKILKLIFYLSVKQEQFRGKKNSKVVPVLKRHTMNMYWGNGGKLPRILNVGARQRWMICFTPRPLYSRWCIYHRTSLNAAAMKGKKKRLSLPVLKPEKHIYSKTTCKLLIIIQPKRTCCLTYCLHTRAADNSKACGFHNCYAIRVTLRILFFQLLSKSIYCF